MIELMGAVASPMNNGETYSAMQTGVFDGAENNEVTWDALKHSEVAKYYSYTRHLIIPDYLLISTKALNAMSAEDQQALKDLVPRIQKIATTTASPLSPRSRSITRPRSVRSSMTTSTPRPSRRASSRWSTSRSMNDVRKGLYDLVQQANAANPAK